MTGLLILCILEETICRYVHVGKGVFPSAVPMDWSSCPDTWPDHIDTREAHIGPKEG